MEQIIKYNNRKLYSKNEKKYLTLLDIHVKHKAGVKFSVKNKSTGEDLTDRTILQAVVFFSSEEECAKLVEHI